MNIFSKLPNLNCDMSSVITLNNNNIIKKVLQGLSTVPIPHDSHNDSYNDSYNEPHNDEIPLINNQLLTNNSMLIKTNQQPVYNNIRREMTEVSLISASRQLGYYLALVKPDRHIESKQFLIYNMTNICTQLTLWGIDRGVVGCLMYIPIFRPYKNIFLHVVMSLRIGFLFRQSIMDVVNQSEIDKIKKGKMILSNMTMLALKTFETTMILCLERSVYRNNPWIISFGILTASHYGYTRFMTYINDKFDGEFNDEIDNCGLYQPLYPNAMYSLGI
jgi:hypothetical protein